MARQRIAELLDVGSDEPLGRAIDAILIALVAINVAAAVADSVPALAARYATLFDAIEIVSVAIFTLEYGLRLWSAPEYTAYRHRSGWSARLAYVRSPTAIIDFVSVAPVYAALATNFDLRSLLLFRLFRFFKLARYSPGLASLFEAIAAERRALGACGVILFGVVLVAASAMHEAEGHRPEFATIPDAMYWAFVTLTTVGYGDVVPITGPGKVIASMTAVVGILMLALPVGILASAFADEIRRRDFVVTLTMVGRVPLFADLEAGEVAGIMRVLQARSVEAGEPVVQKGEQADAMYFVSAGAFTVELPDRHVQLKAGDFFGEIGMLNGGHRTATVRAVSPGRLLALEARDLQRLMDRAPDMARRIREIADARAAESG